MLVLISYHDSIRVLYRFEKMISVRFEPTTNRLIMNFFLRIEKSLKFQSIRRKRLDWAIFGEFEKRFGFGKSDYEEKPITNIVTEFSASLEDTKPLTKFQTTFSSQTSKNWKI